MLLCSGVFVCPMLLGVRIDEMQSAKCRPVVAIVPMNNKSGFIGCLISYKIMKEAYRLP